MRDEPDELREIRRTFEKLVNMTPRELEDWLRTPESQEVGWGGDDGESVGHASGRRIVKLKRTRRDDLSADDYGHMKKVSAYIARHTAQRPEHEDPQTSRWRYSLMNWGHDPEKRG